MNLVSLLIPCLLVSTVFVSIAVINVSAPAIGTAAESEPEKEKPEKPPLNLTVTITDQGYTLAGSGGVLPGIKHAAQGESTGPTIPLIDKQVSCTRYLDTWPPPRSVNKSTSKCTDPDASLAFKVYDVERLSTMLITIKDQFPEENKVIIAAEPDIEFEALTDVMDSTRDVKLEGEERRPLFPEVVLSPGIS